jgi:hypothetical protein
MDEVAEFIVGVCNLAVIEMTRVFAPERLRGIVRAVRIVEVQPKKKRPSMHLL